MWLSKGFCGCQWEDVPFSNEWKILLTAVYLEWLLLNKKPFWSSDHIEQFGFAKIKLELPLGRGREMNLLCEIPKSHLGGWEKEGWNNLLARKHRLIWDKIAGGKNTSDRGF